MPEWIWNCESASSHFKEEKKLVVPPPNIMYSQWYWCKYWRTLHIAHNSLNGPLAPGRAYQTVVIKYLVWHKQYLQLTNVELWENVIAIAFGLILDEMENVIKITKMFLFNLQNSCSIVLLSFIPGRVRVCNVLHFYSQDHFVFKILTFGSTYSARRNHTNLHTNTFYRSFFLQQTSVGRGENSNIQPVLRSRAVFEHSRIFTVPPGEGPF